jgi:hypothetical protein
VDTVIHNHKENARRRRGDVGMPAIQEHRNVMVPVQKNKLLLVDNYKESIDKFTAKHND